MELRHIFTQNNIVLCFFLNCLFTYFSAGLLFYRSLNEKISLRKCFLLLAFGISISALSSRRSYRLRVRQRYFQ